MKRPDLTLQPGKSAGTELRRVAGALVNAIRERVSHPASDRDDDVHAVRTTIKRLRALLRLIRPVIGETRFTREDGRLRKEARRLTPARDDEVARRTLAALAVSAGRKTERQAFAAVLAAFPKRVASPGGIERTIRGVARQLALIGRGLHGLRIGERGWKTLEPGLRATYTQGRKRMAAAWSDGDDRVMHRWRIRVKNLYYQLQFLEPLWPKRLGRTIDRLQVLQWKLGDAHDLVVVRALLQRKPDVFGPEETVGLVVKCLEKRGRKLRRVSESLGREIFGPKPGCFTRRLGRHWAD